MLESKEIKKMVEIGFRWMYIEKQLPERLIQGESESFTYFVRKVYFRIF